MKVAKKFTDQLRAFVLDVELETRDAFDEFIVDSRRVNRAVDASERFIKSMEAAKLRYASDGRHDLITTLKEVLAYVQELLQKLEGDDPPN